jgi:hypothetical protein
MTELERITELELVPVVELPPWSFSDRPSPQGPSRDHREVRLRHWFDCLADAGITGLGPIEPGSMHVAVSEFTDLTELIQVLQRLMAPESLANEEEHSALSGGFAVVSDARVLVEPNCCGDLKDWCEWKSAAAYREPAWRILWIGHPWLSVRAEDNDLILSQPHESSEPHAKWIMDRQLIAPALQNAMTELECLSQRIAQSLLSTSIDDSRAVYTARALAGLPACD